MSEESPGEQEETAQDIEVEESPEVEAPEELLQARAPPTIYEQLLEAERLPVALRTRGQKRKRWLSPEVKRRRIEAMDLARHYGSLLSWWQGRP